MATTMTLTWGAAPARRDEASPAADCARDAEAFARMYEAHAARMYSHIRARVGSAELAEDLTAAVFLRAWKGIDRYQALPGRPIAAWLFTIANNLVVDHYRRSKREVIGVKGDPRDSGIDDPERRALQTDLHHEIRRAIARLKPEQQQLVSMRLIDGLDYQEISVLTGKSAGALRVTLCRALAALRVDLERQGIRP